MNINGDLSKFQLTGLAAGAALLTVRYIFLTFKASQQPKTFKPGCLFKDDPSNPCVIGEIPAAGSREE